jgi:hypothetical protein
MLSNLGNGITVHGKLDLTLSDTQDGIELTVNEYIGITADRRCKVRVEGRVEGIMLVLGDIEHTSAEVFGALHGLGSKILKLVPRVQVLNRFK